MLSLASVVFNAARSRAAVRHLALVMVTAWGVFAYRDLWPLATFTLTPLDRAEGWLLWTKVGFLTFAGVVVPLLIPRQYIPVDPSVCPKTFCIEAILTCYLCVGPCSRTESRANCLHPLHVSV